MINNNMQTNSPNFGMASKTRKILGITIKTIEGNHVIRKTDSIYDAPDILIVKKGAKISSKGADVLDAKRIFLFKDAVLDGVKTFSKKFTGIFGAKTTENQSLGSIYMQRGSANLNEALKNSKVFVAKVKKNIAVENAVVGMDAVVGSNISTGKKGKAIVEAGGEAIENIAQGGKSKAITESYGESGKNINTGAYGKAIAEKKSQVIDLKATGKEGEVVDERRGDSRI